MGWKDWKSKNKFSLVFSLTLSLIGILLLLMPSDAMGYPNLTAIGVSFIMGFGFLITLINGLVIIMQGTDALTDRLLVYVWILSSLIFIPINFFVGRIIYWIYGKIKSRGEK
jgi:hypothetical protein